MNFIVSFIRAYLYYIILFKIYKPYIFIGTQMGYKKSYIL